MKNNSLNNFILFSLCFVFGFTLNAQEWCGTDPYNSGIELSSKEREQAEKYKRSLQEYTQNFLENADFQQFSKSDDEVFIIPLVVHVIHDNGIGNISYEQILDGVRILNEDMRRLNADTTLTRSIFREHAADSRIEFRLAKLDPDGNCTNGVVRINDPFYAYNGNDDAKGLSVWPTDRYFNYWLANVLPTDGSGTLLGYARFPWWGVNNRYGVMQRNDEFGSIGTAAGKSGRTTVHEVGHCLGLYHTFQSGCGNNCSNSGDEVCDTPPVSESSWACNTSLNTCDNDMNGPSPYESNVADQIENYMSYNSCQNMLSNGQVLRMHWVLENIAEIANLISPENNEAAGLNLPDVICKAEFNVNKRVVCLGEEVSFMDDSFHGPVSWEWTFEGANQVSSSDKNPTVTFFEPGKYTVSLTVSDGSNQATVVKEDYITVMQEMGLPPLEEDFESYNSLDDSPWFLNEESGTGFKLFTDVGLSGTNSMGIENYNLFNFSASSNFISSPIDMSRIEEGGSIVLTFKHAYRRRTSTNNDWLRVYFSGNCGESWSLVASRRGGQLSTLVETDYWTPDSADDWTEHVVTNVNSNFQTEDFRVRFEFIPDGGNNLFIDDINISSDDLIQGPYFKAQLGEFCTNESITFTDASIGVEEWTWDFGAGASPATASGIGPHEVTYSSVGEKTVTLTSEMGESHQETVFIDACLSTEEFQVKNIKLFPNPSNGKVKVSSTTANIQMVNVIDASGRQVYNEVFYAVPNEIELDLTSLNNGVFIVKIFTSSGVYHERIILNK